MRFKYILPILLAVSWGGSLCGCDQAPPESPPVTDPLATEAVTAAEEHAHAYTETVTPPTCEGQGFTRYTCACGDTYDTAYTAPTGHTFTETVTPPTCETEGFTRYTCDCGYAYDTDHKAPTGHTLTETVTLPTCETEGFTRYICDCGYTYDTDHIPPTGHTLTETVTPPTCEGQGFTRYTCACGYTYHIAHTPPTGHTYTGTVISPTCTEAGYTRYTCAVCAHGYDGSPTVPLAHAHATAERIYPTVSRDGYTLHTCPDCGESFKDTYVPYRAIVQGAYVDNTEALQQGIDTSKWNHKYGASLDDIRSLDFEALKAAGMDFVILKAGSTKGIDPAFEMDYLAAKAAGLQVGAYFYAYSTTVEDTLRDAETLLTWLGGKQFEYPIYFDAEDESLMGLGQETLTELCRVFAERLQEAGYYAALYTNTEWLYNLLDTEWVKENLDVWYARYTVALPEGQEAFSPADGGFTWKDGTAYESGEPDKRFGLWQYTDSGGVEGFSCRFDFNYAFKDYKAVMVEWGLNGF